MFFLCVEVEKSDGLFDYDTIYQAEQLSEIMDKIKEFVKSPYWYHEFKIFYSNANPITAFCRDGQIMCH